MLKSLTMILISFFTLNALACVAGKGYLPENKMYIPVDAKNTSGITQAEFNEVIDKVLEVYTPIVRQKGGTLIFKRLWNDGTVNAYANREGSNYIVQMFGGLARHNTMTRDGFALVACHEVGHHIGGMPLYSAADSRWASTEGQSDYFAVTKCLRKIMAYDDNENIVRSMSIDKEVELKCSEQFSIGNDSAICKRISMGGFATSSLFSDLTGGRAPSFTTPDKSIVHRSYESHPDYQCRLDTYFQGANCTVDDRVDLSTTNANIGACNRAEGHTEGLRPLCWYKPQGINSPVRTIAKTPLVNGQSIYQTRDKYRAVPILIDITEFQNVVYMAVEISKPNGDFSNPNGSGADTGNNLRIEIHRGTKGNYKLIPANHLPSVGTYKIRTIALDKDKRPVSKFSNNLTLIYRP